MNKLKIATASMLMAGMLATAVPASFATEYTRVYSASAHRYVYVPKKTLGQRISAGAKKAWHNPVVKKGTIGAGIGVGAAALTDHSLLKGGLVGAAAGAGWGATDRSRYFSQHPLGRYTAKGAMAGAAAGSMLGGVGALPGAAIGAGVGAAAHYVKTH